MKITTKTLDKSQLPKPIFDEEHQFIELYWKAWEYAWDHIYEKAGAPQSPYMDEALTPKAIWIWDTCFMVLYCRYAPKYFPGIESLNNFYIPLHDKTKSSLKIHHIDNPPLFAWVEYEYFKLTGDLERLKWVLEEKQYLQKHYDFINNMKPLRRKKIGVVPTMAKKYELGYQWRGTQSGMDNTPRGRGKYLKILWIDLLAQQGLAAKNLVNIAKMLNNEIIATKFQAEYEKVKKLLNQYYWNEEDGVYYDIKKKHPKEQVKVKTPATYWPMLANICDENQAKKLAENASNPDIFGGKIPYPSVSRDDPDFNPEGMYWRGGVWLPMAYMTTKALEQYGFYELADTNAYNLLKDMLKTYNEYEPATIWEVYSPTEPKPGTYKFNRKVFRPNFCGWSALGPISMLIENVLGFHHIYASEKKILWRLYRKGRHGIRRLKFGTIITDILYEKNKVEITSNEPYTLYINSKEYKIKKNQQEFEIE